MAAEESERASSGKDEGFGVTASKANREFRDDFGVYCCPHVFRAIRAVLLVIRDPDGEWQFLCGQSDDTDDCHLVGVGHLLERDPSLAAMANLDIASGAERVSREGEWDYFRLEDQEQ